jgi:hypothetical protein
LLNLERVAEVNDFWGDSSANWRLSPAEVRRCLSCRVEFRAEEIAALKLNN